MDERGSSHEIEFLRSLTFGALEHDTITSLTLREERPSTEAATMPALSDGIVAALGDRRLWGHQADAVEHLLSRRTTIIATRAGSGKSLCYQLPAADAALRDRATTIVIHPTKALLADQLRSWAPLMRAGVAVYALDGDGTWEERRSAARLADVILTTPEQLHGYILGYHRRFERFLRRLRYVAVDDCHQYVGLFGSQVSSVLRRLRRIATLHGSEPTFALTSATLANPTLFAEALTGLAVEAVTEDQAPIAAMLTSFLHPYAKDRNGLIAEGSSVESCARLLAAYSRAGVRSICFTTSRQSVEHIYNTARSLLPDTMADTILPYRSGYLPTERRRIEQAIASGAARAVVATSALEIGINLDSFGAVILHGFPGTVTSFRQQCGRIDRGGAGAIAVVVTTPDALDAWVESHPIQMLERAPEWTIPTPANPWALTRQLACAAWEAPLTERSLLPWSIPEELRRATTDALGRLTDDGVLIKEEERYLYALTDPPHRSIPLRGSSRPMRIVATDGEVIGFSDAARSLSSFFIGAQYTHLGRFFKVVDFDEEGAVALVEPEERPRSVRPTITLGIEILEERESTVVGDLPVHLGLLRVTETLLGYESRNPDGTIEVVPLEPRERTYRAESLWLTPPLWLRTALPGVDIESALHGIEHVATALLPLFALCDRSDIAAFSSATDLFRPDHPHSCGTILLYEVEEGGTGVAEVIFRRIGEVLDAADSLLGACGCIDGCPYCIISPRCHIGNRSLSKSGAVSILQIMRGKGLVP